MATKEQIALIEEKAKAMRHEIVDMIGCGGGKVGHLGGSSSIADVVAALYFYKMKHNPKNPKEPRDVFLLSKGHAALVQYAALAQSGYIAKEALTHVKTFGSKLQGHPDMTKTPGVEANTGSLGQGLSLGLGIALGKRLDGDDHKVYVVMGDGELAEGQIWEAAMAAANFKADRLVGIVDRNMVQATATVAECMDVGDVKAKWQAFGWEVIEVNGHCVREICDALDKADTVAGKPVLILAHTVKGKCVSFAEGKAAFHNCGLTQEQYEQAHHDIDQTVCQ